MKIKTNELTGAALDWAVAKCEGATDEWHERNPFYWHGVACVRIGAHDINYTPSTDWSQAGPIIERRITRLSKNVGGTYTAQIRHEMDHPLVGHKVLTGWTSGAGPTLLIAAMRCYVASKLGDEVDVTEELLSKE